MCLPRGEAETAAGGSALPRCSTSSGSRAKAHLKKTGIYWLNAQSQQEESP